ncbi:hypothetical protein NQ318_019546 [Aromia moschata]|uniref:G-protein coupled receptors family 1 profile domain-containing protein n=1 Tax=Aromia moschata TaxID=1265417 RepID=A0AAV8Z499_9CUCU|nr:hypothetical protein NQ318_019546 [Aromia moschata]
MPASAHPGVLEREAIRCIQNFSLDTSCAQFAALSLSCGEANRMAYDYYCEFNGTAAESGYHCTGCDGNATAGELVVNFPGGNVSDFVIRISRSIIGSFPCDLVRAGGDVFWTCNGSAGDDTWTKAHYDLSYLFVVVFIIAGGLGNILVCLAVLLDRRLQNVTNYFLLSLAIADLLVSLFVMPLGAIPGFLGTILDVAEETFLLAFFSVNQTSQFRRIFDCLVT